MAKSSRRKFLRVSVLGGVLGATGVGRADYLPKLHPSPSEIEGPFYPVTPQKDKDFDLTRIEGQPGEAEGEKILIEGRVLDSTSTGIEDVTVDIWQANAAGRYRHPHDSNPAPLDPNFQGWAIVKSGVEGKFRFLTVMPGPYPAGPDWTRPPHIHFKVSKRGYVELITQMYFAGHPLNRSDRLLQRKSAVEQLQMTARRAPGDPKTYTFTIVLQKI